MEKSKFSEIVAIAGVEKKALTAQQKEFNRLTQRIEQSRNYLEAYRKIAEKLQQRAMREVQPLLDKFQAQRVEMVHLLDRMVRQHKFSKSETEKLHEIIITMSFDLAQAGFEALKEIHDRYNPKEDFDSIMAQSEADKLAMLRAMMHEAYGVDLDEMAEIDTFEAMTAFVKEKRESAAQAEETFQEPKNDQPKTAQQLKAEAKRAEQAAKRKEEEQKISQSVREVYLDLVKAFHPDREPNEAEKVRKTAILQRVTAVYEANDLMGLLQLQLELERIDSTQLGALADDKLRYFNKNLRNQLAELAAEQESLIARMSQMTNQGPSLHFNPFQADRDLEKQVRTLKKDLKTIKTELEELRDFKVMKEWLRGYQLQANDWF